MDTEKARSGDESSGCASFRTPEEMEEFLLALMGVVGVGEVRDFTGLDRLGIPVHCAIRPAPLPGTPRFCWGSALSPEAARVSAMMDAVKLYSSRFVAAPLKHASYEEIGLTRAVDPNDLILPTPISPGEKIHWTSGKDILYDEPVDVPSNAVLHPYDPVGSAMQLFRSDMIGIGGGRTYEEAVLQGICEVIERDALSRAPHSRSMGRRLVIDRECEAGRIISKLENAGIDVHLWLLNGPTSVPVVAAALDETETSDPFMLVMGSAADPDPESAAQVALLEVLEKRVCQKHGAEQGCDDLRVQYVRKAGYSRLKKINRIWFIDAPSVDISEVQRLSSGDSGTDIKTILGDIEEHAERVCVCDLTATEVPVVRVVIPGFEVSHTDPSRKRR